MSERLKAVGLREKISRIKTRIGEIRPGDVFWVPFTRFLEDKAGHLTGDVPSNVRLEYSAKQLLELSDRCNLQRRDQCDSKPKDSGQTEKVLTSGIETSIKS